METLQIVWIVILIICSFGLGVCVGALHELGKFLKFLEEELTENDRQSKELNRIKKEHEAVMEEMEEYKTRYDNAYNEAMRIISLAQEKNECP